MRARPLPGVALAGLLVCAGAAAQDDGVPAGPHDPSQTKILALEGRVLQIEGLGAGVGGAALSLQASVADLAARDSALSVRETGSGLRVMMTGDVLFAFDSAQIRPDAKRTLRDLIEVLKQVPDGPVIVEGHTDSKGADDYNQALSERRAGAVVDWLVAEGKLDRKRLAARGMGETDPVAPNTTPEGRDDPEGRQRNRRVEFVFPEGD